jgi:ribosomal protein S27E
MDQKKISAQEAAKKCLEDNDGNFAIRSCWNCNNAHEHLKNSGCLINCFSCGKWFYKGVDITEQ